jgi:DNA-binding protein Fis
MMSVKEALKRALISEKTAARVDECAASDHYVNLRKLMHELECDLIEAIVELRGNRSQASYSLELQRTTLVEKLKRGGR